ncbi:MAG: SDR family oxidoreductase [Actinomycetia bacterium]|nr:SDR family oxidoreductase [Actinomycetes bacterium]
MSNPIVVTGSASGLGAALARRFSAEGASVIGVDRHDADVVADLGTPDGRSQAVAEVERLSGGSIDGLVSCAATTPIDPDPANVVSVNYFGMLAILDELLGCLTAGEGRSAVAISSIGAAHGPFDEELNRVLMAGDEPAARQAAADGTDYRSAIAYNAAKLGVALGVRERAESWARAGVRLNCVAPGRMETPMLEGLLADPVVAAGVDAMPSGIRLSASPDEIGGAVHFLLGPDASFVHGQVLFVDGGVDAQLRPTEI